MPYRITKKEKHIQPFEKLARHVIIRGWLDSIGHGSTTSWQPVSKVKHEANTWLNSEDYTYWIDVAGLDKTYVDKLYTKFIIAYNKGIWKKENPHSTLMNLFEIV